MFSRKNTGPHIGIGSHIGNAVLFGGSVRAKPIENSIPRTADDHKNITEPVVIRPPVMKTVSRKRKINKTSNKALKKRKVVKKRNVSAKTKRRTGKKSKTVRRVKDRF